MCPYYLGMIRHYRITGLGVVEVVVADEAVDERLIIPLVQGRGGFWFERLGSRRPHAEQRASQSARESTACGDCTGASQVRFHVQTPFRYEVAGLWGTINHARLFPPG